MDNKKLHAFLVNRLVNHVQQACILFHGSVQSFGRTVEHNKAVGGSKTSWHLDWLAMDVKLDNTDNNASFQDYLQKRRYRVLMTGQYIPNMAHNRSFHIQYAWPVIKDFKRVDQYSHLDIVWDKFPFYFIEYLQEEVNV